MIKIYKNALDKTKPSEQCKNNAKELYDKINCNREDNIVSIETKRKSRKRPLAVLAASLAMVLTLGGVMTFGMSKSETGTNNSFVLSVNAAEVTRNNSAVMNISDGSGLAMGEGDDGNVTFSAYLPIGCKGDNIDTITYEINRGAFDIATPEGDKTIVDGKKVPMMNTPRSGSENDIFNDYSSFTVNYNNQPNDDVTVSIVGDSDKLPEKDREYIKNHIDELFNLDENTSLDRQKEVTDRLLGDIVIKATVKFKDGTTQTQSIKSCTKIMKPSQAFPKDEVPAEKDKKDVFLSFELEE
ncbi:MAG: hypothetical protein ACI4RI_07015 [Ruminococcus sp.]